MSVERLFLEAAPEGDSNAPAKVSGVAYSGGTIQLPGWRHPVVVDLSGLQLPDSVPLLTNHENRTGSRVGMVRAFVKNHQLLIEGEILSSSSLAKGILEQAKAGADWQLSIGAEVSEAEVVRTRREVNGRAHSGPFHHVKKSQLREVSVVAVGADPATRMSIAATFHLTGGMTLDFEAWLEADGLKAVDLDEDKAAVLKAAFDRGEASAKKVLAGLQQPTVPNPSEQAKSRPSKEVFSSDQGAPAKVPSRANESAATQSVKALQVVEARAEAESAVRQERERVTAIQEICAGEFPKIEREAINLGWTLEETSQKVLKAMRENRPQAEAHLNLNLGRERPSNCDGRTLEAACALAAGMARPEDHYDEAILEQATRRFRGGIGLQELILEAAWANGYTGRTFRDSREALRMAFASHVQAGLSNINIGGILSNVANKFLLEGFYSVERTWRTIAAIRNVSDFKTVTSYRLVGKDQYERVAPGGEIKHGSLGEESFTNKADTYGLMLAVDRRDIINDDLGAITLVPRKLGRGSGLKINDVFWATYMKNSTFFTAAQKNYIDGVDTALGINGLTAAETAFMEQVDGDGKPIGVMPMILLVPPAMSAMASQLNKSLELRETTSNAKYPVANPHQGKFRTEVSRYLSNAQYQGNSSKAWYLLADPADLPVIEVAFLNGQESPVIETAEADFNLLGVQMRGYHDFGCALQDPRGGLKSKGEA